MAGPHTQSDIETALKLRSASEELSAALPPLLAEAQHLAATVILGDHGRRRAGQGESFWQYRRAIPGDEFTAIDWRRSARSDLLYIRQTEWEAAQTVSLWVDHGQAMGYRGKKATPTKGERAAILALALSILLNRAGERIALIGTEAAEPKRGIRQLERIAGELARDRERPDYGTPPLAKMPHGSRAVFLSDFLGPRDALLRLVGEAADQGVQGALVQVLDETEETFPFDGRTIFQSMSGEIEFETDRARSLRDAYKEKLSRRKDELADLARETGWLYLHHVTAEPPRKALLWLYAALEGFRR